MAEYHSFMSTEEGYTAMQLSKASYDRDVG